MRYRVVTTRQGASRKPIYTTEGRWTRRGFMPEEAREMQYISSEGLKAPYIQAMIRWRISLHANAIRYNWSPEKYRKRIAEHYEQKGVRGRGWFESYAHYFKDTFYRYFKAWQQTPPPKDLADREPEWTPGKSPHKKKRVKAKIPKAKNTRLQSLNQKIADVKAKMVRAINRGDQRTRRRLEKQLNDLDRQRGYY